MVKFLKPGKVVIILAGKYAGKKAVVVKVNEDGDNKYKFPYAVVCGVSRPPRKVLTKMSEKTVKRRTSMKVFTKVCPIDEARKICSLRAVFGEAGCLFHT